MITLQQTGLFSLEKGCERKTQHVRFTTRRKITTKINIVLFNVSRVNISAIITRVTTGIQKKVMEVLEQKNNITRDPLKRKEL